MRLKILKNYENLEFGNVYHIDESLLIRQPTVINIFPYKIHDIDLIDYALNADLSNVRKLRIDPINKCNVGCLFCGNDQSQRISKLELNKFDLLLKKISHSCERIIIGCNHEPLMLKNINAYAIILKKNIINYFKYKPIVSITTNGTLLSKTDISDFIGFLSWLHISIPSHLKATYEKIVANSDFDNIKENVQFFRHKYPSIQMHAECVISNLNKKNIPDLLLWIENLGFNSANLRRVTTDFDFLDNSYLSRNVNDLMLSDCDWKKIIDLKLQYKCECEHLFSKTDIPDVIAVDFD